MTLRQTTKKNKQIKFQSRLRVIQNVKDILNMCSIYSTINSGYQNRFVS